MLVIDIDHFKLFNIIMAIPLGTTCWWRCHRRSPTRSGAVICCIVSAARSSSSRQPTAEVEVQCCWRNASAKNIAALTTVRGRDDRNNCQRGDRTPARQEPPTDFRACRQGAVCGQNNGRQSEGLGWARPQRLPEQLPPAHNAGTLFLRRPLWRASRSVHDTAGTISTSGGSSRSKPSRSSSWFIAPAASSTKRAAGVAYRYRSRIPVDRMRTAGCRRRSPAHTLYPEQTGSLHAHRCCAKNASARPPIEEHAQNCAIAVS